MSVQYTSGLGTYLWDQVSGSQTGQASSLSGVAASNENSVVSESSVDIASISERAQLFSGLETLSRNNPDQFRKTAASITQHLASAAQNPAYSPDSTSLKAVGGSFEKASKSGNFADLFSHESLENAGNGFESTVVSQILSGALPQIYKYLGTSYAA